MEICRKKPLWNIYDFENGVREEWDTDLWPTLKSTRTIRTVAESRAGNFARRDVNSMIKTDWIVAAWLNYDRGTPFPRYKSYIYYTHTPTSVRVRAWIHSTHRLHVCVRMSRGTSLVCVNAPLLVAWPMSTDVINQTSNAALARMCAACIKAYFATLLNYYQLLFATVSICSSYMCVSGGTRIRECISRSWIVLPFDSKSHQLFTSYLYHVCKYIYIELMRVRIALRLNSDQLILQSLAGSFIYDYWDRNSKPSHKSLCIYSYISLGFHTWFHILSTYYEFT